MPRTTLMWFRRDLRVADNAALREAAALGDRVAAVFVPPAGRDPHAGGAIALDRIQRSAASLAADLARAGCELEILSAGAPDALADAARRHGATIVTCSRDWTPAGLAEEPAVASALSAAGVELRVSEGQLLAAPGTVTTGAGAPFRVFTPFYRQWLAAVRFSAPEAVPERLQAASLAAGSSRRPARRALPRLPARLRRTRGSLSSWPRDWPTTPRPTTCPRCAGPANCRRRSPAASSRLGRWRGRRSKPSGLMPRHRSCGSSRGASSRTTRSPTGRTCSTSHCAASSRRCRGATDPAALAAWAQGQTGWPLVDAGMRQLRETGWMHNRVRMVVASVLTKDLLVPWQDGAAVFEQMLADYDPAANAFNWQWVAGSGADAAPYFRIFSPTLQGTRFDPDGAYVRRWVPELAGLPSRWIHRPSEAPTAVLDDAGVRLGTDVPAAAHRPRRGAKARARGLLGGPGEPELARKESATRAWRSRSRWWCPPASARW